MEGLCEAWPYIIEGTSWIIRDGIGTWFWEDLWIPSLKEPLRQIVSSVPDGELHFPVAHYADEDGWHWSWLKTHLSDPICSLNSSIKPPRPGQVDFPFWNVSSDGNFSLKFAFVFLFSFDHMDTEVVFSFKLIWKWRGPHRCRLLLWKIAHECLMVNAERRHRNITNCNSSPRCHDAPEMVMHTIRDCEEIQNYSKLFVHHENWAKFFSMGLLGSLKWNPSTPNIGTSVIFWPILFGVSLYSLWNNMNNLVFSRNSQLHTGLLEFMKSQLNFTLTQLSTPPPSYVDASRQEWHIAWSPPSEHTFKINVDGSRRGSSGLAACRGLIRDHCGRFIKAFHCNLGCAPC